MLDIFNIIGLVIGIPSGIVTIYMFMCSIRYDNDKYTTIVSLMKPPADTDRVVLNFDQKKVDQPGTFEHTIANYEKAVPGFWKYGFIQNPRSTLTFARNFHRANLIVGMVLALGMPLFTTATVVILAGFVLKHIAIAIVMGVLLPSPFTFIFFRRAAEANTVIHLSSQYIDFLMRNEIFVGVEFTRIATSATSYIK